MAEFPALPLFTDAYLADTRHLTAAQHGAYLLLLFTAWRSPDCALPDDDDMLARFACMDKRTWVRNKPTVMAFWCRRPDARWQQKRLVDERQYVEEQRSKKSAAGKASALKKKERHRTPVEHTASTLLAPTPTPTHYEEAKASSPPLPPSPPPDDDVKNWPGPPVLQSHHPHPRQEEVRQWIINRLPHLGRQNASEVSVWLRDGADPDEDIYPTVEFCISAKGSDIGTFRYFTRAVLDKVKARKDYDETWNQVRKKYEQR